MDTEIEAIKVQLAIIVNDYEMLVTGAKRDMEAAIKLLEVLPHAVVNERTDVVVEYLDRITTRLVRSVAAIDAR
jgi:hypothetical protein